MKEEQEVTFVRAMEGAGFHPAEQQIILQMLEHAYLLGQNDPITHP